MRKKKGAYTCKGCGCRLKGNRLIDGLNYAWHDCTDEQKKRKPNDRKNPSTRH